jgi:hypothetical protein
MAELGGKRTFHFGQLPATFHRRVAERSVVMAFPPKSVEIVARKSARSRVALSATARLSGGQLAEIAVVELSAGGFLAEFPIAVMSGLVMSIDLPGIPARQARVVRQRGTMIACTFLSKLAPDELARLKD